MKRDFVFSLLVQVQVSFQRVYTDENKHCLFAAPIPFCYIFL